jgi:hypothetical protein
VTCIGALATLIDICEEHALTEKNKTKIEEAVEVPFILLLSIGF